MRIIGGKFKGRKFIPPAKNWPTRPTTDFAKEGLFNILNNHFDFAEMRVLDLFGGTGSHGYEFISRGCQDVTYVDKFPGCVAFAQKTAAELGIAQYMKIVKADVFKFISSPQRPYDYIFAGPPYPLPNIPAIPDLILEYQLLKPNGWLVLEHNPQHNFENHPRLYTVRNYGTTIFSVFKIAEADEEA
ncbi:MAG: RsmD family RNA methyltransferase [Saprospiraceae bacterium]